MQQTLFEIKTEGQKKFEEFHARNPKVYDHFVRLARQAKGRGKKKIGMRMLMEIVRWEMWLATDDPNSDFKINNNYNAYYARLIMESEPDLDGIFNLREMKS